LQNFSGTKQGLGKFCKQIVTFGFLELQAQNHIRSIILLRRPLPKSASSSPRPYVRIRIEILVAWCICLAKSERSSLAGRPAGRMQAPCGMERAFAVTSVVAVARMSVGHLGSSVCPRRRPECPSVKVFASIYIYYSLAQPHDTTTRTDHLRYLVSHTCVCLCL